MNLGENMSMIWRNGPGRRVELSSSENNSCTQKTEGTICREPHNAVGSEVYRSCIGAWLVWGGHGIVGQGKKSDHRVASW